MKIACAASYFNFFDNEERYECYLKFRKHIEKCRLFLLTVEIQLSDKPFHLSHLDNVICLKTNHVKFHKNNALNIATQKLIELGYDLIIRCDADIEFTDLNWSEQLAPALRENQIIHCCSLLKQEYSENKWRTRKSIVKAYLDGKHQNYSDGGAWAFRKDFFELVGYWDDVLNATNVTPFFHLLPQVIKDRFLMLNDESKRYQEYLIKIQNYVKNISFMNQTVVMYNHAKTLSRRKLDIDRVSQLNDIKFDFKKDTYYDDFGVVQFTPNNQQAILAIKEFIKLRELPDVTYSINHQDGFDMIKARLSLNPKK
ncbi:MAG: hypothetical protein F6J90_00085 [Moorea sp. SIOASIH]|uniref:hypothetical protein n=1 Tax=Moorena sp. SIOASIH TaxID=2607817 RepID=UPI0013B857DF|nr:hypothetical protein [Moorena sp. SIOASIH]NEO34788.1 hypothetical protein [Moorena sp. SIOASIH]